MFRVQPKTKACVCLACTAPLLLALYHADEASMVSGQPISAIAMAQPPHLPEGAHAEFDAKPLSKPLTELRVQTVFQDFTAPADFTTTTGA